MAASQRRCRSQRLSARRPSASCELHLHSSRAEDVAAILAERNPSARTAVLHLPAWGRFLPRSTAPGPSQNSGEPPGRLARLILTWPGALTVCLFPRARPGPLNVPQAPRTASASTEWRPLM